MSKQKTLASVKLATDNGDVTGDDIKYLFARIEEADKLVYRISMLSDIANQRNRHLPISQEVITINGIANDYLHKIKEA